MTLPQRAQLRADLLYGQTGTGKTYQLAIAAQRMWKKYGKRTRLIDGDTGGTDTFGDLIDEQHPDKGIVIPCGFLKMDHPIEALDKLTQGYWPDVNGKLVLEKMPDDIGLYEYEGLTSFGDTMMAHLSRNKIKLSQDPAYTYVDGTTAFSGTNMSYYGEIQNRLHGFVVASAMMPLRSLWTALEGRGEEEGSKSATYGPSIVGKKATGKAGQWFGNMLHLESLNTERVNPDTKQVDILQRRVMYLQPHADPLTKIPFPAKVRAPFNRAGEVPFMIEGDKNIAWLYDFLESLRTTTPVAVTATK